MEQAEQAFARHVQAVCQVPIEAVNYTIEDIRKELMFATGSLDTRSQKVYNGKSLWTRAKRDTRRFATRSVWHMPYAHAKEAGRCQLSRHNVDDIKCEILQRYLGMMLN